MVMILTSEENESARPRPGRRALPFQAPTAGSDVGNRAMRNTDMPIGIDVPLAATIPLIVLALVLTRLWANATVAHAARELNMLGMRPGRSYRLGATWVLLAARDRRNLVWATLALAAWIAVVVSVNLAKR
jgi:hypothetical protein